MTPVDPLPCLVWVCAVGRWLAGTHTHDTVGGRPFCLVEGESPRSYPVRFVRILPRVAPQRPAPLLGTDPPATPGDAPRFETP